MTPTMTAHVPCPRCHRLLVPLASGKLPHHRIPPRRVSDAKAVPLTGADALWCGSEQW